MEIKKNYIKLYKDAKKEIEKLKLEIEKLKLDIEPSFEEIDNNIVPKNEYFTDKEFWNIFISNNLDSIKNKIEYLLKEFGTKEPCNRFDVGNCIEFIINEYIKSLGLKILEMPNAKKIDVKIYQYKSLSIKYSSSGNIKLHNSNNSGNIDMEMRDTILLTPNYLYLISNTELINNKIDIKEYLKNTTDGLQLKRKLLTELNKKNYPYIYNINLIIDKENCKNRLCSKLFFKELIKEYNKINNN